MPYRDQITFRFTIGSINPESLKFWDRNAPDILERLSSLMFAYCMKYKTSVSIEPYFDSSVAYVVERVQPYVTDTIWIGKMNQIKKRVKTDGCTVNDMVFLDNVLRVSKDEFVHGLYQQLKDNPQVRWKDSIKEVIGLPEEPEG
jgi:hypothetical protein